MTHQVLFVGGLHRSGTTLLARCLGSHPEVSDFHGTGAKREEGQFLQSVYPPAREYGGPGCFAFDHRAHLTEDSPLVTDANRTLLREQWNGYWDLSRSILLEKSPPNLVKARFLLAMFPGAKFVFIVRHPIAVSLATQKWSETSERSLVSHWLAAHRIMEEDLAYLDNALVISYEAFVRAPHRMVARILDWAEARAASFEIPSISDANAKYFAVWRSPGWKVWRKIQRSRILNDCEAEVQRYGYSLTDLDRYPAERIVKRGAVTPFADG